MSDRSFTNRYRYSKSLTYNYNDIKGAFYKKAIPTLVNASQSQPQAKPGDFRITFLILVSPLSFDDILGETYAIMYLTIVVLFILGSIVSGYLIFFFFLWFFFFFILKKKKQEK